MLARDKRRRIDAHLDGVVVRKIGLQDVDIGPSTQVFRDSLVYSGLVSNYTNDCVARILGYLAKELKLATNKYVKPPKKAIILTPRIPETPVITYEAILGRGG